MSETARLSSKSWSKDHFIISTDSSLIPVKALNTAFGTSDMYWATSLPEAAIKECLSKSLCFGLYDTELLDTKTAVPKSPESYAPAFIGIARCITDYTTFGYLTDVYIAPSHRGKALGKWMIGCVRETLESMPHLRRSLLITADWERSVPFYEGLLDMQLIGTPRGENGERGSGVAVLQSRGRSFPAKGYELYEKR